MNMKKKLITGLFGGFTWDSLTLGRRVQFVDLLLLLGYYVGAATILILMGKRVKFKYSNYLNLVLQFLFGGLFSALVIFYFISSSFFPGHLFVMTLVGLLILNEFIKDRYERLTLSWIIFGFCGTMLLNFAFPHIFKSIHSVWFYISVTIAAASVFALRKISYPGAGKLWPAMAMFGVLTLLYIQNWIPPVPLAKKSMEICRQVEKTEFGYLGKQERQSIFSFFSPEPVLHRRPDEAIYCFASIFLPKKTECNIAHQWWSYDTSAGDWQPRDRIAFDIRGGREAGYRGYSYKKNLEPGRWKVTIETPGGQVIGVSKFKLVGVPEDEEIKFPFSSFNNGGKS